MTVFSLHLDDAILFILVLLSLLKYTHALHFWRQQLLCQLICKWAVLQPANIQKYLFQISRNTYFKYPEILISNIQKYLFHIFRNTYFKYSEILSRKNRYFIVSNNQKYIFKKCIQIFYGITVFLQKYILIYSFIST